MRRLLILLALVIAVANLSAETVPGLGTLTFPTTTKSPAAQAQFIRGLLLLHVFEYADAAQSFQAAEKLDPAFAMAYWGEAMTYDHPVWNQTDVHGGQSALAKFARTPEARAARTSNPRERAFLAAVELLYAGNCAKRDCDARYSDAMQQMARAYPADDEVQLFYALSLLGRSQGTRDVPVYLHAAAISKAVFARNPQHPGAAHYWIHGMDDPQHAAQALIPARALSKIAPDAGHAQHMCSHIFMALGMWDDVVAANRNAIRVDDQHDRAAGRPILDCGHYAIWLQYAYYQQGRPQDGDHTLAECQRTATEAAAKAGKPNQLAPHARDSLVHMRAIALIESHNWTGPIAQLSIDTHDIGPVNTGYNAFATGYAAAERNDASTAQSALGAIRAAQDEIRKQPTVDTEGLTDLDLLATELHAVMLSRSGQLPAGIAEARAAATRYHALAFDFGPPSTVKPPDELLGELYLQARNPTAARQAFTASLKTARRRAQSLAGLQQAAAKP